MADAVDRLQEAGLLSGRSEYTEEQLDTINSLSDEEVGYLISACQKLGWEGPLPRHPTRSDIVL